MAEEARARYEKAVFKVVDLVILHDLYAYVCVCVCVCVCSRLAWAQCWSLRDLLDVCRMTMLRRTRNTRRS